MKIFRLAAKQISEYVDAHYETLICNNSLEGIRIACDSQEGILGVCSEGMFFVKYDMPLSSDYIQSVLERYDIILPYAGMVEAEFVREQWTKISNNEDALGKLQQYIRNSDGMYESAFCFVCSRRMFSSGCMVIAKQNLFCELNKWIIHVIDSAFGTKQLTKAEIDFLFSVLTRTWVLNHKLRIKEENTRMVDASVFTNAAERICLLKQYMDAQLSDLIHFHKEFGFQESLADPVDCQDDFEGKIPVWVCWWQGIEQLPELIQACLSSLQRNLPKDITTIRFITLENVMNYVTFSADVIQKFNENSVTYTQLSDALRAELLYRYGGMWIDATYYVSKEIPRELFLSDKIFTIAFENQPWSLDIMDGRWTASIWIMPPKHPAMQFLMEGLWTYWEKEEKAIDYFFVDYVLDVGYRHFHEIQEAIDDTIKSPNEVYALQIRMNQAYTKDEQVRIPEESIFYKLNRRLNYVKKNAFGQQTIYGHMVDQMCQDSAENRLFGKQNLDRSADKEEAASMEGKQIIVKLSEEERLGDSLLQRYLNVIRETNAENVLDVGMNLSKFGAISRMTIDEVIKHEVSITCVLEPGQELYPIWEQLYDSIAKNIPEDMEPFDLIIYK